MKLTNLNDEIRTLSGTPISVQFLGDQALTFKAAFIALCELYKPDQDGSGNAIRAYNIGIKLQEAGDELELSQEDTAFLSQIVLKQTLFMAAVVGQLSKKVGCIECPQEAK